jgi:hypothetical protein
LAYSPDGLLFATAAKQDRLVRIWYQNHQCKLKKILLCIIFLNTQRQYLLSYNQIYSNV